jgi:hypothetical protein
MWSDFERLRRVWTATREGSGGVAALAGFSFQLLSALVRLVCRPDHARQPSVFIEALSDLVSGEDGYLVVTQAKLSLRSGALKSALVELWQIHCLAQAETPELEPNLRYAVLSSLVLLKDVQAAVDRWQPEDDADISNLSSFKARLRIAVEADPRLTLAVHLVNALGDSEPFRRIDEWLGRLLGNPTIAGFESSCKVITQELKGLEAAAREREHRFYIWRDVDRAPDTIRFESDRGKATLTGQTPDRTHLVEGRFARRWFYDELLRQGEDWLSQRQSADGRLSVFWIAGRSGTGKSVALLHFLADLQRHDEQRVIIWLHQQADRLAEAIRWARPFLAEGRQVLLAADDPYTPERHQRVAGAINDLLRELDSLAVAHPEAARPSLIFCGPTEQGYLFEDDLGDFVEIEPFYLRPESERDISELRKWYTERTGETDLPVGEADDVLIVQLFFEWAQGQPIKEFSQRFRRRLEGMVDRLGKRSLFDILAEVLALNRLYSLYPAAGLDEEVDSDPALGAAFDQLRHEDNHLSLDPDRGGYRLTHPHLANAIYTTWFGRSEHRRYRKEHLRVGIEAALDHGDSPSHRFAPLWAMSRLAYNRARMQDDSAQRLALVQTELREVLRETYARCFANSGAPLVELPVWVNLDRHFALALTPSPVSALAKAVEDAQPEAAGLRLSCHTLLSNFRDYREGVGVVARILQSHRDWFEWHHVASHYVGAVGASGIGLILEEHVSDHWMLSGTRTLLGACLRASHQDESRAVVLRWLKVAPQTDSAWSGIFTRFFDTAGLSNDLRHLGQQFLKALPEHSAWSHVWERLYEHSPADRTLLAAQGTSWLESADPAISGWDRVWEVLWQASDHADSDLRRRGRRWLDEASPDHPSWAYVWLALCAAGNRPDQDLRERGLRWLDDASPHHRSWAHVWKGLWDAAGGSDQDLQGRGLRWLDEADADHPSWAYVWLALWAAGNRPDQDLRERGLRWLDEADADHPSWAYVWLALWAAGDRPDQDLRERGRRWLDDASPDHPSWTHVWEALWKALECSDRDLWECGRRWLDEASPDHPSWAYVWLALWAAGDRPDQDLWERGRRWLDEVSPHHNSWGHMWRTLRRDAQEGRTDLEAKGVWWLQHSGTLSKGWPVVWNVLWHETEIPPERLRNAAQDLLTRVPVKAPERIERSMGRPRPNSARQSFGAAVVPSNRWAWKDQWSRDWQDYAGDPDRRARLAREAREWLSKLDLNQGGWTSVWSVLWEATACAEGRQHLVGLASEWYRRVDVSHPGRDEMKRFLDDNSPDGAPAEPA